MSPGGTPNDRKAQFYWKPSSDEKKDNSRINFDVSSSKPKLTYMKNKAGKRY